MKIRKEYIKKAARLGDCFYEVSGIGYQVSGVRYRVSGMGYQESALTGIQIYRTTLTFRVHADT